MEIREYAEFREEEIRELYQSVGWQLYVADMAALKESFSNSLLVLAAYQDDELLGLCRIIGDGINTVILQDVLVSPCHQRQGIGSKLVKAALERYQSVRQVLLVTDDTPETRAFYASLGFRNFGELGLCGFMKIN
ncbi:MAG: GNAT family N-acetyltransferase [Erysipelotrichaceae bacterium]|nr:GNAT family N-acetyltransferase [Erysipelotrichaceae bacterium]